MRKSMLVIGTTAAIALGAAPALAQTNGYGSPSEAPYGVYGRGPDAGESGPQYSTPAEHARTERLNAGMRDGSYASPAVLNGQAPGGLGRADAASQARSDTYHSQLDAYHAQMQRYRANLARYDQRWAFENYPRPVVYAFHDRQVARNLAYIPMPGQALFHAPVEGPNGWVGKVRNVRFDGAGRPRRVEIALDRQFAVWVPAWRLRYARGEGVVFTAMSRNDLWGLPGVYVRTADYD